jgi:hypothetical protein
MTPKLPITERIIAQAVPVVLIDAERVILSVDHAGKHWEIDVRVDFDDDDGGIEAHIVRDGIYCTGTEFGWSDKHDNEPQG